MKLSSLDLAMPSMQPWRATSRQVCGLFPFVVGSSLPLIGAPLGIALNGGGAVCADPISWFERGMISAPSGMVLGLNGYGKSSLIRRIVLSMAGFGVHSFVLGDIKPDYTDVVSALGGQVIRIGHGHHGINPLDAGNVAEALELITDRSVRRELLRAAHERKKTMVISLVHIIRRQAPSDREETILGEAIRIVEETREHPVLADLLDVIRQAPEPLRHAALDRGSLDRYREITEALEASLMALLSGRFGQIFAASTTVPMKMDRSVVFDVHDLLDADTDLQAAVLLSCWSYGFGTVEVAQILADQGLMKRQRYQIIMDELWRILQASSGMVSRVDALTRLNRSVGVGQLMITHSMTDLASLQNEEDRLKALGFVERSKMLFLGALPSRELSMLRGVMEFSQAEESLLSSWNAPGTYDAVNGRMALPVGIGKFLLKTSNAPGVPFQVRFVEGERELSDTNKRWEMA